MISKEKAEFVTTLADDKGYIDPARVVEVARDPTSPIHGEFEWDNAKAADDHRIDQAKTLIRFVKLTVTIHRRIVVAPYYVPDPQRPVNSKRYVELTVAGRNADVSQQVLLAELERIAAAIRRAQQIADVLGLSDELARLLDDVTSIKTTAERRQDEKDMKRRRAPKSIVALGKRKPPRRGRGRGEPA